MKCIHRYLKVKSLNPGISILGIVLVFLLFAVGNLNAQNQSPEALKQQMAKIRQSTNWEDPVAAKKANEQIKILSKQLMMTGKQPAGQPPGLSKSEAEEMQQEGVEDKMKLWGQMWNIAREGGAWDLAKPLREEIVEDYKEAESPVVKSKDYLDEMTVLCIDMSLPNVQLIIDQMEQYKSIQILIITGGDKGAAVNLENLISKAANYPLKQLYIINFKNFVSRIPKSVGDFNGLTILALYNNSISQLPSEIGSLSSLKKFYIDMNPVIEILPIIQPIKNIEVLGLAKTKVPLSEVNKIKKELPECKILMQ